MITELSNHIADFFLRENLIEKDLKIVYQVGFDVMISTSLQILAVLGAGLAFHNVWGALLYLLCFMSTRAYSGGCHARTRTGCLMTMLGTYGLTVLAARRIDSMQLPAQTLLCGAAVLTAFDILVFWLYAPVKNNTKILGEGWRRTYRKKAFLVLFLWKLVSLCLLRSHRDMAVQLCMIQAVTTCLILACRPWTHRQECLFLQQELADRKNNHAITGSSGPGE